MKTMKKTIVLLAAIAMMTGYAFAQQPEKTTATGQADTTEQPAPEENTDGNCCDQKKDDGKSCDDKACDQSKEEAPKAE